MSRKDAPTVAKTLLSVVDEIVAEAKAGSAAVPAERRHSGQIRVVHLLTGDGIPTNQAAARRVLHQIVAERRYGGDVDYKLAMWTCASHVTCLCTQVVV